MSVKSNPNWTLAPLITFMPLALGVVFIYLSYWASVNGIDTERPFAIQLTIIIPEIIIWTLAAVGATRFKQYAVAIRDSADGKSLDLIANGLLLMVAYIIVMTTAGTVVDMLNHSRYLTTAILLRNHLPVAIALASVMYLYGGSRQLRKLVPDKVWPRSHIVLLVALSTAFFIVFAWDFYRSVPHLPRENGIPRFILPVDVLLFTYVLPHIILWLTGLLAVINLAHYAAKTPGKLYRYVFKDLYRGILLVYVCIFIAQLIIISSLIVGRITLGLGIVYGVLLLAMIGFLLVFRGAKRLHDIEHAI